MDSTRQAKQVDPRVRAITENPLFAGVFNPLEQAALKAVADIKLNPGSHVRISCKDRREAMAVRAVLWKNFVDHIDIEKSLGKVLLFAVDEVPFDVEFLNGSLLEIAFPR